MSIFYWLINFKTVVTIPCNDNRNFFFEFYQFFKQKTAYEIASCLVGSGDVYKRQIYNFDVDVLDIADLEISKDSIKTSTGFNYKLESDISSSDF